MSGPTKIKWKRVLIVLACACVDLFTPDRNHLFWAVSIIGANLVVLALSVDLMITALRYRPAQRANHPRLKHLRIAGRYDPTGRDEEAEMSPLHLRD